jgi:hypothetical protein
VRVVRVAPNPMITDLPDGEARVAYVTNQPESLTQMQTCPTTIPRRSTAQVDVQPALIDAVVGEMLGTPVARFGQTYDGLADRIACAFAIGFGRQSFDLVPSRIER